MAASGEELGEGGGLTLVLTPIVQPNIYFSYVNVLETFIILILRPNSKLGLQGGLLLVHIWGCGGEGGINGREWSRPGNPAEEWVRVCPRMADSLDVWLFLLCVLGVGH